MSKGSGRSRRSRSTIKKVIPDVRKSNHAISQGVASPDSSITRHETLPAYSGRTLEDFKTLFQQHPIYAILIVLFLIIVTPLYVYTQWYKIPELNTEILILQKQNKDCAHENLILNTRLAPFMALATEWHPGKEDEAMKKLLEDYHQMKQDLSKTQQQVDAHDAKLDKLNQRMANIELQSAPSLKKDFPDGYTTFGIYDNKPLPSRTNHSQEMLKVDWNSVKIVENTDRIIKINIPHMMIQGTSFYDFTIGIQKQQDAVTTPVSINNTILFAKVLLVDRDLVIVALGIQKK